MRKEDVKIVSDDIKQILAEAIADYEQRTRYNTINKFTDLVL